MAKITNAQIFEITHQKDVDSYDHRTNYANIKNRHNELDDKVNASVIGTTNAETTAARPYHTSMSDRLDSIQSGRENYIKTGFEVTVNATDGTDINVSAGEAKVGGIDVKKGYGAWTRVGTTITITENGHGRSNSDNIVVTVSSDTGPLVLQQYVISNVATNTFDITGVDTGDTSGSCEFASVLGSVTNPTTARYDIVVINSDNSLAIVIGNDSADRFNPAIVSTQRPLAVIDAETSSTFVLTDADITDISTQGVSAAGEWYFAIADAVAALDDRSNSDQIADVIIKKGNYYEEVDLAGISNVSLIYENGAKHYRVDASSYCIKSINTVSNETTGIKIINGDFYGNGKAGALTLIHCEYTDEILIKNCEADGNALSTSTFKNISLENCDNVIFDNNIYLDTSGNRNKNTINLSNSTFHVPLFINGIDNRDVIGYWRNTGNDFNIASIATPVITALTYNRIAYIDPINSDLRTYDFDGRVWTQVGNDLNIAGATSRPYITALSSTRVAYIDYNNDDLRTYDFDGTDWTQVGNDLNISGIGIVCITALTSSRIAFMDDTNDDLRVYEFDGTDWTQVGNDLNFSQQYPQIAALSENRIAFIDTINEDLRTYDWDGTDWSQVGNDLNISGIGFQALCSLSSNRVAFIEDTGKLLKTYDFNGTDWTQTGGEFSIGSIGKPIITAMGSNRIVLIDETVEDIEVYDGIVLGNGQLPSPAF